MDSPDFCCQDTDADHADTNLQHTDRSRCLSVWHGLTTGLTTQTSDTLSSPDTYSKSKVCYVLKQRCRTVYVFFNSCHVIYVFDVNYNKTPQRDRATRYVSRNLVECCTTAEQIVVQHVHKIRINGVRGLRSTVEMMSTSSIVDEFCWQHDRAAVAKFFKSRLRTVSQTEIPLFWINPNFLSYTAVLSESRPDLVPKTGRSCQVPNSRQH